MYKEARTCVCGYSTQRRDCWCVHRKTCSQREDHDPEKEQLRAQLAEQLQRNSRLERQNELLTDRNAQLELLLGEQLSTTRQDLIDKQQELKVSRKRKDRYAELASARCHLTEPQRRAIAIRQGWKCNICRCELAEYDVDHIAPLWKGGADEDANRQAVCVACHRQKTDRERIERSTGEAPIELLAGQVVVG